MANSYTQLGVHIVTAVKHRQQLIDRDWLKRLHGLSNTILTERKHQQIAFGGEPDHIHLFVDMHPSDSVADMIGAWKSQMSGFISDTFDVDFNWQRGYGAFSVSKRDWPIIKNYVMNQEEHHRNQRFKDEYIEMLKQDDIEFDEEYLFAWRDDD